MTNTLIPAADQYQIPNQPMLTHETYQARPSVVVESFADRVKDWREPTHQELTADAHAAALTGLDLMVGRTRPDADEIAQARYIDSLASDEQPATTTAEHLVPATPEYFAALTDMGERVEALRELAEEGQIKVIAE